MKSDNQKARLFAIYQILKKYTDETHGLSMREILHHLEKDYDIHTTRQTVTSDFALLEYPLNIELDSTFETPQRHFLSSRILEHEDILTVIESIQYNPFLSVSEKKRIINAIKENICSIYEKKEVSLKNLVDGQISNAASDTNTLNRVSLLNQYAENCIAIYFAYPQYDFENVQHILPKIPKSKQYDKEYIRSQLRIKFNGTQPKRKSYFRCYSNFYSFLPLFTFQKNNKWYLCAKSLEIHCLGGKLHEHQHYKNTAFFEIDKISNITPRSYRKKANPLDSYELQDIVVHTKDFPVYDSYLEDVLIDFDKELAPLVYDYLGKDIEIVKETDTQIRITAKAEISPAFYGWLFSLGTGAKVRSPQNVVRHLRKWIKGLQSIYATPKNF